MKMSTVLIVNDDGEDTMVMTNNEWVIATSGDGDERRMDELLINPPWRVATIPSAYHFFSFFFFFSSTSSFYVLLYLWF